MPMVMLLKKSFDEQGNVVTDVTRYHCYNSTDRCTIPVGAVTQPQLTPVMQEQIIVT